MMKGGYGNGNVLNVAVLKALQKTEIGKYVYKETSLSPRIPQLVI